MTIDPNHFIDLVDGRFNQTSAADLRAMFAAAKDADHLVVHFHGGLVSRTSALNTAAVLLDPYRASGAWPVFFLWNSDLPSTIKASWDEIPQERAFIRLVQRLTQFALGKLAATLGARGGNVDLPSMRTIPRDLETLARVADEREPELSRQVDDLTPLEREQVERELDQDEELRVASAEIARFEQEEQGRDTLAARDNIPPGHAVRSRMAPGVREDIRRDFFAESFEARGRGTWILTLAKHGAQILARVVARYRKRRDHGLYTTIVEEVMRHLYVDSLGQLAWEMMKRDTLDAFGGDPCCGGTAFLEQLGTWWRPGRRVTLVGHSTGAIYIGNLLVAADPVLSGEIGFETIFLAAAISFEDMHARLPVFRRRVGSRIRAFGLGHERERGYYEVPVLYQGSLLYMVSGLFEMSEVDKEIVGMQRYHLGTDVYDDLDVREVREYLAGRCYWAPSTDPEGNRTDAVKHGGFPVDAMTAASLRYLLSRGLS